MEKETNKNIEKIKNFLDKNFIIFFPFVFIFFIFSCWLFFTVFTSSLNGFYFLPVGQGDSELIVKDGIKILIDGGPPGTKLVQNLDKIFPFYDKYLDIVILTHPQLDHFGGFLNLFEYYKVGILIENGAKNNSRSYKELENLIQKNKINRINLKRGDLIEFKGNKINFLYPPFNFENKKNLNDSVFVFLADIDGIRALFTSDANNALKKEILKDIYPVDILKVAHHGSFYSLEENFLKKASPLI